MAAFTSKAAGNWNASGQTTWNEVGVPGNGDTVFITHNISVVDARIIGTSPSDQTTAAVTVTGATLTVANGGSLTCRGNVFLAGATLQVGDTNGGGTFEFDAHLATTTTTQYYCAVGTANNQSPRSWFKTRGTAASRSVVRSNAGGGNGFFGSTNAVGGTPQNDRLNGCFLDVQRCDFLRIGNGNGGGGTFQAFYPSINSDTAITYTFDRCTFTSCGDIIGVYGLPADTNFNVTNCRFAGSLGSFDLKFLSTGTVTGTRLITGTIFNKSPVIAISNATIEDNFFADGWQYAQGGGKALSIARNFIRLTANSIDIPRCGDWANNYVVVDASTYNGAGAYTATAVYSNPHWTTPQGSAAGTYAVTNCVFDSFGSDGVGDIDYGPNATGYSSSFTYNIILPDQISDAGVPRNAGTLTTNNGWSGEASVYDHNTFYSGGQGPIALAEAGNGFANMVDSYRSNIVWNAPGTSTFGFNYMAYYPTSPAGAATDQIVVTRCDYNCGFNVRSDGSNLGSNTNGHYNVRESATVGTHDVYADPNFVDTTRNFSTWVQSIQPTWGIGFAFGANLAPSRTDYNAHGMYLLALAQAGQTTDPDYDSRYTLANLLAYIRAGFAPRNAALRNAGHDGVTIGAVEAVATSNPLNLRRRMLTC